MDLKVIKQVVELMKRSEISEFEIEEEGFKLRLTRKNGEVVNIPVTCRLDIAEEVSIYSAGGVLQRFAKDFLESSAA